MTYPMKIIYLHQYFNTPAMSGGTRSYEMARRLVAAGHDVHMITSSRTNDLNSKGWLTEKIDGINVHWLSVTYSNKMGYSERIKAFISFALAAGKKAVQIGGDIVFATSTPLTIALPGVYAARRLKAPMVFEVRDLWPELPIAIGVLKNPILIHAAKWLERFAYQNSARVIALSAGMAEGVASIGYPIEKVSVIPNGSDIELFQVPSEKGDNFLEENPYLKGGPLVVYAGTLGVVNGVDYLVEIACHMGCIDSSVRFVVAGEGKEYDTVRRKALNLDVLEKNLWMIPPLPKEKVPHLLSAATLTTSLIIDLEELWNNSANKFFDSLAAGKPIMINHKGWQADLLQETGAGIVVPPDNPQEAAKILYDFIKDEQSIKQAAKAAEDLAVTRFSRDLLAKQLLEVFQEVGKDRVS